MKRSPSLGRVVLVLCVMVVALAGLTAQMMIVRQLPTLAASWPGRSVGQAWERAQETLGRLSSAPVASSPEREVQAVWERVRQSGAYHFTADIHQTTVPRPTISNVGRQGKQETLHLEGETDLPARQLHLTLWSQGGSVLDAASGVEIKVEGDRAYGRQQGQSWQEISNFTGVFAPQGDFMAFLAAAKNVKRDDVERESTDSRFTLHV
jgi:hypothetical protein